MIDRYFSAIWKSLVISILLFIIILQIISGIRQTKEVNLLNLYTVHFLIGKKYTLSLLNEMADNQVYAVNFYKRFNKLETFVQEMYPTYYVFPLQVASKVEDSTLSAFEDSVVNLQDNIQNALGVGGED